MVIQNNKNPKMPEFIMSKRDKNIKSLYYPMDISEKVFMSFDIYSRVNVKTSTAHNVGNNNDYYNQFENWANFFGVYPTSTNKSGDYKTAIYLYIPPALKTQYDMQYTETEASTWGAGMESLFAGEGVDSLTAIGATAILQGAEKLADSSGRFTKKMGVAKNPFMEVLFQTPSFRTHTFDFKFNPINEDETRMVTNIIKEFKTSMHPGYSQRSGKTLLTYPDEFEISFLPGYQEHLFKINRSYLTSCSVDYNAEGIPSFFERTKAPTAIALSLTFKETTILTKDDIENGY